MAVREAPSAPSSGEARGGDRSDAPRTARPVDGSDNSGRPERQRPHDRGGRGGGGGGGHYGGYYGRPYYYGGWGWGWGAWSWWPGYWGYYPPYYGPRYRDRYYDGDYDQMGALDLDVYPGRAEVYVDGDLLGKVDAYDGFPRYLWLERGTYDIVFYLDGYKTLSRQITIYPGSVIDIDDRLEPGDAVRPEDLATKTHERRDARIRDERERRERMHEGDEEWRDRVRQDRDRRRGDRDEADEDGRERRRDALEDESERGGSRHGRVRLDIEPSDASVYLDGRFVGTAEQLARAGLSVNPGEHQLSVVRPGYDSEEVEFRATAGEEVELEVELDREDGSR